MAPDIAATGLSSHRRQERYSSSNRLAHPTNNLKPSSTCNSGTPRLYRAFLLASICTRQQQCRRFCSAPHRATCIFSLLERRRQVSEDGRSAVADQLPATSMRALSVRSMHALTPGATSMRRHALCVPHRIAQDIEPEVNLPVSTPRPGAAQRPTRFF
jgi:hypothetical protein